jgi:uncharacterized protein CbrC (UPF0167 family)
MPTLPTFKYHPDPLSTGSVVQSDETCDCCNKATGYLYAGPAYTSADEPQICPWCIADGSAAKKFDATFFDADGVGDGVPEAALAEICERTPGYNTWQGGHWPGCCGEATRYLAPVGHAELQAQYRIWEGSVLSHIIYNMAISGGAATRLLHALRRDQSPTAYLFECPGCGRHHVHVDQL